MIYGMLVSACIAAAVFSRKLYCDSGRKLDEGITALAIALDLGSLTVALAVLAEYYNIIS